MTEVALRVAPDGISIPVKVRAGGRRNQVGGVQDGALRVEVTTAPEKGKANQAVRKLLAKALGVPAGSLELLSGETCPAKVFRVTGIEEQQLRGRLRVLAGADDA